MAIDYQEIRICLLSNQSVIGCFHKCYSTDSSTKSDAASRGSLPISIQSKSSSLKQDESIAHIVLHLSPSGGCYTLLDSHGRLTKHLTRFFPAELRFPLLRLVQFRNAHVEGSPYICEELLRSHEHVMVDYRLRSFRFAFGCKHTYTSTRVMESIDGNARIRISKDKNFAQVKYLTPITCSLDDRRYAWVTRWIHISSQTPSCYFYQVIQRMVKSRTGRNEEEEENEDAAMRHVVAQVPRCPPSAHEPDWEVSEDLFAFAARPLDAVMGCAGIKIEWTPTAVYRVVRNQSVNVVASILNDRSTLEFADVTNRTLLHKRAGQQDVYVKDGVPKTIRRGLKAGMEYDLEAIANKCYSLIAEAQKFGDINATLGSNSPKRDKERSQKKAEMDLIRVEKVRKLGQFTALSDRSIKAVFDDRTVLHSNPGFTRCHVIFKDGAAIHVNVSLPLNAKRYVKAAHEFYQWVFEHNDAVAKKARRTQLQGLVDRANHLARSHQKQVGLMLSTTGLMVDSEAKRKQQRLVLQG